MPNEAGKQMGKAIRAVLDMQDDCIRLFHDLDKHFSEYVKLWPTIVTLNLGSSITRRAYLADGLFRLYYKEADKSQIFGVNICFYGFEDTKIDEPLLIAGRTQYLSHVPDPRENAEKPWDPWYAFLKWSSERVFDTAITIDRPTKRAPIDWVTVAAKPLYDVNRIEDVLKLIELVGQC